MKDAQKPDHVSLNSLISRLKEGRFVIPDFQREFEWRPWDISELMRSIFLDYYIGSLLLWKGKKENFRALSCEKIYGFTGEGNPEYIVLDGQQRLTAMLYAFHSPVVPLPNRKRRAFYFVRVNHFMDEEYDQAFDYEWDTKQWMELLADRNEQYASHVFPLSVVGAGGWELPNWVQGYERFWKERTALAKSKGDDEDAKKASSYADNAKEFGAHLKGVTEQYQISYIELDKDLAVDKVCDIFTQINSRGIRLDVFDLVNALLKPKGLQLKYLWREAAKRLDAVDSEKMNVYILQVMSILRQGYCSPKYLYFLLPGQEKAVRNPDGTRHKEVLVPDIKDFEKRWNVAVDAMEDAIKVLRHPQEYGAVSTTFLPYVSILPVFASLRCHAKSLPPNRQLAARRKLRHWYWASVFTNRYSGSVESTSAKDFIDVKAWFDEDVLEPGLITEFAAQFRKLDLRNETKRGTSIYNGVFNLLVLNGARDWMTGDVPQHGDLDDHHIVPASWGKKHLPGSAVGSILNRTPLTAKTNREVIRDRLPNDYLPEWFSKNGEATVRAILNSHFISSEGVSILLKTPFTADDYEAFIVERQRSIQQAMEDLLIKERLDLEPHLRELDGKLEATELKLRELLLQILVDPALIPPHIAQKIKERTGNAAKKNPAIDTERVSAFEGMLEFFDLREVQETILAKALWPKFQHIFANKESLATKFDQLAELRNGIRHSRTVSDVVRMEGEASIIWFGAVLGKAIPVLV
jgi:hypothetical protein